MLLCSLPDNLLLNNAPATQARPPLLFFDLRPPRRHHGTAKALLGCAGLHIAAAEAARAIEQLIAVPADGQARAVVRFRCADAVIQPGHILRDNRRHLRLARLPQEAAALPARRRVSH